MIIDKLYDRVEEKGNVCVGLDTALEYIPDNVVKSCGSTGDAVFEFNRSIIDSTCDVAACYKVQIAYYEALGMEGIRAYSRTLKYIKSRDSIAIADIKRGDIAKTAEMYAKAHFEGDFESDFITVNPYMGFDTIEPYIPYVTNRNKGLFVLIRTSNRGARDLQFLNTEKNKKLYHVVGEKINEMGKKYMGNCGYSAIGGVIGCTHQEEGSRLRSSLNTTFFLIPGYGAQGGTAEDISIYLKDGNGGVVNSSRGILLAYRNEENGEENYGECARKQCIKMRDDIWKLR
ncbi:orotidine-5'-phosphate decarboxylase [Clostridium luticellarii]|uniref:Orotidine 5'-phosphate decarboxylase n=1 Tax=Clostridium luticellarii TaxID=1691940 RepID=A0A2T0BQB1_9CLOT|nr:orotidine-5'-phosphate decarboxylase [Clostridium luticellarii]MCI1944441.1 orotidine-5'-phosphate decarboxylase [Clostridium luticellarii]MCI1967940.1 orotidine-5'-phosphate decarboxylase [Clostridium luticellarii]MCI1995121.1 orotidine-5'-phosphate decarboxylase [Clostridium luticellarii]MCI2039280.1 orotidine-5'-phosphate decarboxylase [Clostridium luticellarii]PRR86060.1 orotidine 5'-phosphate decarboxylase [Clostridium luticellarii]